jgi:hypothetical protein
VAASLYYRAKKDDVTNGANPNDVMTENNVLQ